MCRAGSAPMRGIAIMTCVLWQSDEDGGGDDDSNGEGGDPNATEVDGDDADGDAPSAVEGDTALGGSNQQPAGDADGDEDADAASEGVDHFDVDGDHGVHGRVLLEGGGGGGGGGGGVSQGSYSRGSGSESDSDLFEDSSSDDEGWVDPAPGWDEPFGDPCGQQWLEPLSDDEEEDDDDAGVDGGDVDDGDDDDLMFADDDVDSIDHHTNGGRGGGGGGSSDGAALGITGSIMTVAGPPQAELGVGSMPVAVGASATPAGRHRANLHSASSMRRMYQQSMAASATTSAPVATPSTALAKAAHRLSAGLPRPTNDAVSGPVASQAAVAQLHTRATEMEEEVARLATALTAEERARQQLEGKLGTLSGSVVQVRSVGVARAMSICVVEVVSLSSGVRLSSCIRRSCVPASQLLMPISGARQHVKTKHAHGLNPRPNGR